MTPTLSQQVSGRGLDVHLIDEDLPTVVLEQFLKADLIAWDIETTGLDWTKDQIATCQVFAPSVGAYVVRIGSAPPRNLSVLLSNPTLLKVFHHAMFDLRFMYFQWRAEPRSICCTKIAAKLMTPRLPSTSLQELTKDMLGIRLDKSQRLSNWLSNNLSLEQTYYAAEDVVYLPALLASLHHGLAASGRWELATECFNFLPTRVKLDIFGRGDVFAYSTTQP